MIRRHFFLVGAVCVLALMLIVGGLRLAAGKPGAEGGAAAQGQGGGRGGAQAGGGQGATVTPVVVGLGAFTDRLEVLGVAKGRQSVTVTSNNAELVTGVHFRDGQAVRKGQILVDLQAREEDAAVVQAQAGLELARTNYKRWKDLDARGFAPKAQVDLYRSQFQQAEATLSAARSRRLDRAIRAPFAGVVGLSDVAPGSLINPGTPIVSLDDLAVMRVDFDIPDRYLPGLKQGMGITATSDSYPNEIFRGAVAQFDTRVNEQTRALRARAEFPNPGGRLKPGMLVKVALDQGVRQAVAAPESAVQFSSDQAYVYVITQRNGRTIAEQRMVTAGSNEGGFIEIKEGLKVGERIVADGMNKVQPGQAVKIAGARRQGGAAPAGADARASRP